MTGLRDVQGQSPSIPGTASARGEAERADIQGCQTEMEDTTCMGGVIHGAKQLTTMTEPTNTVYMKKSPGCENRDDSRSNPLPYWYTVR